MITAILGILAALIPLVVVLVRRRLAKDDDPKTQHAERSYKIEKQILSRDADQLSAGADDDLAELDRLRLEKGEGDRG